MVLWQVFNVILIGLVIGLVIFLVVRLFSRLSKITNILKKNERSLEEIKNKLDNGK